MFMVLCFMECPALSSATSLRFLPRPPYSALSTPAPPSTPPVSVCQSVCLSVPLSPSALSILSRSVVPFDVLPFSLTIYLQFDHLPPV